MVPISVFHLPNLSSTMAKNGSCNSTCIFSGRVPASCFRWESTMSSNSKQCL